MPVRRAHRILTVAIAGLLALSACSSGSDDATSEDPTNNVDASQVVTIARPDGPQAHNSNPFAVTSSALSLGYGYAIYEPLVQINSVRPSDPPIPWLAESFEWNDSYTAITFTIRSGVTWNDGEPFTAEDVAYNFQLRKDNETLNVNGLQYDDITTAGDTVTLTFPSGQYVNQWRVYEVLMVPQHIWEPIADPTTELNNEPVGTGPYILDTWTDQAATLRANPDYWGGQIGRDFYQAPTVPTLRYVSYSDNAALTTALVSGEVDLAWNFIADYETVFVNQDPAHNYVYFPPTGLADDLFYMNLQVKPFNNVALRQALNIAHDRETHSLMATSGVSPAIENITGIVQPGGDDFIAAKYKNKTFSPDLVAAKAILTDAGYTYQGDRLIDPDGEAVTVTLTNPNGWSDFVSGLEMIAETLRSLGVDAKVETPEANLWTESLQLGDFQGSLRWTDPGATPWTMYQTIMDRDLLTPLGTPIVIGNFGRYDNAEADAALKEYASATSDAARDAAMEKIQDFWIEDVPAIAIDARPSLAEYSTLRYTGWPTLDDPYCSPEMQKPSSMLAILSLRPSS
jgi:peptide/nickel transport system substrate-binding protein